MAPKVREVNMAVKNAVETDGTRRKHPTVAGAKPSVSARSKKMRQAALALNGHCYHDLAWHQNCVFHVEGEDESELYVFADGSVLEGIPGCYDVVPRGNVLERLSTTLLEAYDQCLEREEEFVLWIAGEKFTGTPKEAFEAVLRLLDAPVEPPKRMLGLIEESTVRLQLHHEYAKAALSDARMLAEAASRLRSSGALDDPCSEHLITLVRKAKQQLDERQ